jgi:hypothetical protein
MAARSATAPQTTKESVPVWQGNGNLLTEFDGVWDSIARRAFYFLKAVAAGATRFGGWVPRGSGDQPGTPLSQDFSETGNQSRRDDSKDGVPKAALAKPVCIDPKAA